MLSQGRTEIFSITIPSTYALKACSSVVSAKTYDVIMQEYNDVQIIVHPMNRTRYRYMSEKTAAHILGQNQGTTPEIPNFPTIKIPIHNGQSLIRVSCITKDDYRPHPHNLVKIKKDSKTEESIDGIFFMKIPNNTTTVVFSNLGLQCVKKDHVKKSLEKRKKHGVDPFKKGFDYQISNKDLHCVRLCFEVFIEGRNDNPIKLVSDAIVNEKELLICELSQVSGSVKGNEKILMFSEKLVKPDDIEIYFFEEKDNKIEWFGFGKVIKFHKQYGISFLTPQYRNLDIINDVEVQIQLRRKDGASSPAHKFIFKAEDEMQNKKRKVLSVNYNKIPQLKIDPTYNFGSLCLNTTSNYLDYQPPFPIGGAMPIINNINIPDTNIPTIDATSMSKVSAEQGQIQTETFEQDLIYFRSEADNYDSGELLKQLI